MKPSLSLLTASLVLAALSPLQAQTTLIDWSHLWNYMHPTTGALPAGSGLTEPHPIGSAPWYADQATFDANYTGPSFSITAVDSEAGLNAGPLGYGTATYMGTPLPPPAEFSTHGTLLVPPAEGNRYSAYFRTTFTVPDDGNVYDEPVIRYILDDGGFIYLDGVLVLRVNINPGINDVYFAPAANTASTETHIRTGQLSLARGSLTGGNTEVASAIAGNATVVQQVASLAPGIHTLAVALHNKDASSSDLLMALQLQAGHPNCLLVATVSDVNRDTNGTANDPLDDTVDFNVRIVPTGSFSASWEISGPVGSSAIGQGGAYDSEVSISGIPIAEFGGEDLALILADSADPFCNTEINIFPPRIIATDQSAGTAVAVGTTGSIPNIDWVFDDTARTMVMNNGAGGARKIVTSSVVDLSARREVLFTGVLQIDDTSSGNELADSFVAYLIIDGDTLNPINLITPHDTLVADGVLSDDELAPTPGTFVRDLSYEIPASASSVQIVIEGINNSASETFTVRDLLFFRPPGGLFFEVAGSGTDLVFTWDSMNDSLYNLRSVTAPSTAPPATWPIWDGHGEIPATPPSNSLTSPRPADAERYFVLESIPIPPIFEEDFESGPGLWTTGSDGAAGTAWELGVPVNGPGTANSFVNCFGTNLTADYDFDGNAWLRSPPIDLTTAPSATLSYQHYTDIEPPESIAPFTVFDFGRLSVLDADSGLELAVIQTDLTGFSLFWEKVTWAVPAAALGHVVRFEFRLQSDDVANYPGWYLDDVLVTVP